MSAGARLHRRALNLARRVGKPVTFTLTELQSHDPLLETSTPVVTSSVPGYVVPDNPDPARFQALGLTITEAVSLVFTPQVHGQIPQVGAKGTIDGVNYTLRHVEPVNLDSNVNSLVTCAR